MKTGMDGINGMINEEIQTLKDWLNEPVLIVSLSLLIVGNLII